MADGGNVLKKKLAVVICTYNKKEYVDRCVETVLASTFQDVDVFVVDNASADGTETFLRDKYTDQITVIQTGANLGGAGGFNRGIVHALKSDYEYIHLMDNDVTVDPVAIQVLIDQLDGNSEVGVAGSLILSMDHPDLIQEFGASIHPETYELVLHHTRQSIHELVLPLTEVVDYVPCCSLMIRTSVLREIGPIDESYFIYWDDIDLCKRVWLSGKQVIVCAASKVWHKRGAAIRKDTFTHYYFWRNRLRYFTKYLSAEALPHFLEQYFAQLFRLSFFLQLKGQTSPVRSIYEAIDDVLQHQNGMARPARIFPRSLVNPSFEDWLSKQTSIIVQYRSAQATHSVLEPMVSAKQIRSLTIVAQGDVLDQLKTAESQIDVNWIRQERLEELDRQMTNGEAGHVMVVDHVLDAAQSQSTFDAVLIDPWMNVIANEADWYYVKSYQKMSDFMEYTVYLPMKQKIIAWVNETNEKP